MKYKTKIKLFDAYQVGSDQEIPEWIKEAISHNKITKDGHLNDPHFRILPNEILYCWVNVYWGDWIMQDDKGVIFNMSNEDFIDRFEPA